MCCCCTFVDQLGDDAACGLVLLLPPAVEEGRLHVDEATRRVFLELLYHRVQDVLNPCVLDVITVCVLNTHTHTVSLLSVHIQISLMLGHCTCKLMHLHVSIQRYAQTQTQFTSDRYRCLEKTIELRPPSK